MLFFKILRGKEHPEIKKVKEELGKAAEEAKCSSQDLNKTLKKNGITLQIKIAAGGKH